jgi:MarR family transcriptional regulator for hemolysin
MGDNTSQKHLADALEIELASLMRTLGQLEEHGLIQRHTCKEDKRVRLVNLTPEGIAIIRQMESRIVQVRTELLAGITPEELTLFDSVIERITINIHDKLTSETQEP